jgi:6-phosphogluconolactonase
VRPELEVTDDPAGAAALRIAAAAASGAQIVLTGGSTPRAAYELLAALNVDWDGVGFWLSDERCVPADHEHSNYRMLREAFLDRARGVGEAHRMEGELGPERGALRYAETVADRLGEGIPSFDLMLLGLGPDAHMCSLFPSDAALGERERTVVGVETPGMAPLVSRITLTLPVVNAAREVVFLVTGDDKADAVRRAFSGPPDPAAPGSLVDPESLTLICDPPAAARL